MSREPLVSIVIDNYNYARYLGDAVRSALAQSWPRREVIVVDDGSTDDSADVLAGFAGRIAPIFKPNGGQGSAFNAGFAASRGEIVCFVDADDMLHAQAIERAVRALTPADAKVQWRLEVVDALRQPLGRRFPDQAMLAGDLRGRAVAEGPLYDSHTTSPTSGNAWSRRFLDQVMPMPEERWGYDADVYLHTLAPIYGSLQVLDEVLGSYRAHGGNHFWKSPLAPHKVEEYLARFDAACDALAKHLGNQGVDVVDPLRWRETSFNWLWLDRLRRARRDLLATVPEGAAVILIDDGEWGEGEPLAGRRILPFLEADGQWAGRPDDDAHASAELRRLTANGARFVAVWWTARWWLDSYPGLREFLGETAHRRVDGDHLELYEVDESSTANRQEES